MKKNKNTITVIVLLLLFFLKKKKPVGTVEVGQGEFGEFGTDGDFDEVFGEEVLVSDANNKVATTLKGVKLPIDDVTINAPIPSKDYLVQNSQDFNQLVHTQTSQNEDCCQ